MKMQFKVDGMSCAACSARVEKVAKDVPGVKLAQVNLLTGTMVIDADNLQISESVCQAVANAGYRAYPAGETEKKPAAPSEEKQVKKRIILSAGFLVILMYFTMGHMLSLPVPEWYHGTENALVAALLQFILTLPVVYLNRSYYKKGFKALWHRSPNMDSLIAVGSGAALVYGLIAIFRMAAAFGKMDMAGINLYKDNLYFESAAMILTLITLGKYLEAKAKGKASDAVSQLMDLSPKTVTVLRDGQEISVPVEQIALGDMLIIRSGGSIAVDGTVISGNASVDQSAITGESIPVDKTQGSTVISGTVCTEGYLQVRADKVGQDTTLSQVIRLVEEAGGSKAPIARLADKVAGVFVPIVMGIALVSGLIWGFFGEGVEFAWNIAISVLVISCPCALGLATPVAIMVATGKGAKMGILFKNAEALENLHKVDTVVLDKTGTVTIGKPAVSLVLPNGISEDALLSLAAALEAKSEHPFAKAILEKKIPDVPAEDFSVLPGLGVSGTVAGKHCYGGNGKLMAQIGISVPDMSGYAQQGMTPLHFAYKDGTYLGTVLASDVIREDTVYGISQLKKLKLQVIMLTGDNEATANTVAKKAGVSSVISDVLPADKASVIQRLQKEGHHVLMVGDGINDAPALAAADVSMAIGSGTDIAMEAADIVLMNNSITAIYNGIFLSRATIRNIRQNLFWAFFYNALGIPVAAGVLYPAFHILLNPMIGASAMSFSSVFVVTNALRLRFFKPLKTEKNKNEKEIPLMKQTIYVEGMMCTHCQARVESVCKAVAGVTDATVNLKAKQVTVSGDADLAAIKKAVTDAGYQVIE